MTPLLDTSLLEVKLGKFVSGKSTALKDSTLLGRVQGYRRHAGGRLNPLPQKEMNGIPAGECYVSRKIDGEFNGLIWDGTTAALLNPGATVRAGLPVLDEAAKLLKAAGVKSALIAGELYFRHPDGGRSRVHDVCRAARRPENETDVTSLCFAVFDLIELEGKESSGAYGDTWKTITRLFGKGSRIHPVETEVVSAPAEIAKLFTRWVEAEGAEGIVARSGEWGTYKIKPLHTLDVVVVGFTESAGERTGLLHDLLVAVMRSDGTLHVLCRVGGGFSEEQRRNMLSDLKDIQAASEYTEVSSDRLAYQMVRPEWVAEISCLDLVTQNTRGGTIDRMTLDWDAAAGTYRTVRRLPLVSVISPQFLRLRDDKAAVPADVSINQITAIGEVPLADADAHAMSLPGSTVLRRQAAVKTLKGAQMVRKLVLWKTNKENVSPDFPAYVLHLTDFSPNRKNPLERDIRVSNSLEQIESMWEAMVAEQFVRGWTLQESAV